MRLGIYAYDEIGQLHPFSSTARTLSQYILSAYPFGGGMVAVDHVSRLPSPVDESLRLGVCGSSADIHWLRKQHPEWEQSASITRDIDTFYVRHQKGITLWLGKPNGEIAFCLHEWDYFHKFGSLTPELFWDTIALTLISWRTQKDKRAAITRCAAGVPVISPAFKDAQTDALMSQFAQLLEGVYDSFFLHPLSF